MRWECHWLVQAVSWGPNWTKNLPRQVGPFHNYTLGGHSTPAVLCQQGNNSSFIILSSSYQPFNYIINSDTNTCTINMKAWLPVQPVSIRNVQVSENTNDLGCVEWRISWDHYGTYLFRAHSDNTNGVSTVLFVLSKHTAGAYSRTVYVCMYRWMILWTTWCAGL